LPLSNFNYILGEVYGLLAVSWFSVKWKKDH